MPTSIKHQRGLTFISIVFILGLIAFFTLLVLKIAPIYINHSRVMNALKAVEATTDIASKSKAEIKSSLEKRFDLNYVEYVKPEDVKIVAQPGYVSVEIDYERVEPIFGNLSVLVEFHEGFEAGNK
ncbi:DUF4845 domain-containing protein [Methylomonas sp. MED-D]|uniref:DUF4845 domain-containing protein n=1 Tax=unclassified Methylomonas TaxID=2608980 RepID=UPI0008D9C796|nr:MULTISPECIES: DUF4845 domain-containing protein [unclassified Methylomonas]MDT4330909.1 DUF4845 domain-containing protein [Methylomonas sp. MV1]NJA07530.1 DUF4845 domain-containing protein [Methylococcaceae bacterium WWC4]OHX37882.1 DUF4845 domain-containing protein [Methylomonas sp. LWB]WGS84938.1 DUF4845 domain-containing protein [Methylomonas sp. UP202]